MDKKEMSRRLICLPDEPPACFKPKEQEVNAVDVSQIDAIARELNKAKMCFRENENLRMCLAGLAYISDEGRAEGITVLDSDVMEATREGARLVVYRDEVKKCVVIKWESPDVDLERFEERAAIIEYDGKLPRTEAERLAREEQDRVYLSQDLTLPKSSK